MQTIRAAATRFRAAAFVNHARLSCPTWETLARARHVLAKSTTCYPPALYTNRTTQEELLATTLSVGEKTEC